LAVTAGVAVVGMGALLSSLPIVLVGLVLFGGGNGCLDAMMNVEAAAIEQLGGKTILPLFHAFFSFGTVLGAGLGWIATIIRAGVAVRLFAVAALLLVTALVAVANVPDREEALDPAARPAEKPHWRERLRAALSAWREPRTYALGVVMLGMAFAEGGANDW